MAGEATPTFTPVDRAKSTGREGFKNPLSQEQRQARADRKAERLVKERHERAVRKKYNQSEMQQKRQDRKDKGKNLNMTEHPTFARHRADLRAAALTGGSLQSEVLGNKRGELSPSQLAQIDTQAFELFKKDHPDLIQDCRANDLYFTPPDKDGNQQLDYRRDPWMRTVDAQAKADPDQAAQIYAQFRAECPGKAEVYALLGHRGLQVARMESQGPDSGAAVVGQAKPLEAAPPTVNLAEQQLKEDIAKFGEYSQRGFDQLTLAQKREFKKFKVEHDAEIKQAQGYANTLNDPNDQTYLSEDQFALVDKYQALLKTPDAAPPVPNTPTAAELQAQQKAQEAAEKRRLGTEGYGKLADMGVDMSLGEAEILAKLSRGEITGPDGTWQDDKATQEYIRLAYTRKAEVEAMIDQLPQVQKDKLKGLGSLLAVILALAAQEALQEGLQAAQTAQQP